MKKSYLIYFFLALAIILSTAWFLLEKGMIDGINNTVRETLDQTLEGNGGNQEEKQDLVWYQVPELGVEFQVEKKVADELIYVYESYSPENNHSRSAFFSIKSLSTSRPECAAGGAMIMHRFDGVPEDYGDSMITGSRIMQFDGFFIELFGGLCTSREDYRNWALLFTGEDSQVEGWMVDDVLMTLRKTSKQPAAQENLLERSQNDGDLVWYQVPELGVEFQVEKKVADKLTYVYTRHKEIEFGGVSFSTEELSRISGCGAESGPLGAITQIKGRPEDYEDVSFYKARNPKQFDEYFVFFEGPQAICASSEHFIEYEGFFEENTQFDGWSRDIFSSMRMID